LLLVEIGHVHGDRLFVMGHLAQSQARISKSLRCLELDSPGLGEQLNQQSGQLLELAALALYLQVIA
jgi:hypothetical protein